MSNKSKDQLTVKINSKLDSDESEDILSLSSLATLLNISRQTLFNHLYEVSNLTKAQRNRIDKLRERIEYRVKNNWLQVTRKKTEAKPIRDFVIGKDFPEIGKKSSREIQQIYIQRHTDRPELKQFAESRIKSNDIRLFLYRI